MGQLPVSSSIISSLWLAGFVKTTYRLEGDVQCRLLKAGISHSYLVTSPGKKYILRIYTHGWRTKTEISEELNLLLRLDSNRVPVSFPIATQSGNYIEELAAPEGKRYAVLFSYAAGEKILNFPAEVHEEMGKQMALLHQHTENMQLERVIYTPELMLNNPVNELKKFLPEDSEEIIFMENTRQQFLEWIAQTDTSKFRQGIVHMDIWFDNTHITPDGKITFFDFDFCGNGWLCLDIAYYILQLWNTEKEEAAHQQKLEYFYKGYESILTIPEEEKKWVRSFGVWMYFFYLGIQCQRYENWSNTFLNEIYLKRFINLLVKKYDTLYVAGKQPV